MTLYDRIILLCDSKGVKGGRMCTEIGISKSTLTDLKMGRTTGLSAKNAQKIASYLGVSVGYLLGEENNEEITVSVSRKIFSKNLRFLMAKTNKSRNEVSEDIGVSYFTFSDWCNGKKYPRVEKIELLAKYFGVTVSELVSEQKNDTKPKVREQNDKKEGNINGYLTVDPRGHRGRRHLRRCRLHLPQGYDRKEDQPQRRNGSPPVRRRRAQG